jgi:hypothetical protein
MRTRVIPAQITTVEDRIAGNFSLTQIIILLTPVLFATLAYTLLPPSMLFVWYKVVLIMAFVVLAVTLSIRIKGKIILNWLFILARYNLRPKYYVFNKNNAFSREVYKPNKKLENDHELEVREEIKVIEEPSVKDILRLKHFLNSEDFNLTYRASRKGGLNVAFEKVSK